MSTAWASGQLSGFLGVHHTTVIDWVEQVGQLLPDAYESETIPEVEELDELETFVRSKKQNLVVDSS